MERKSLEKYLELGMSYRKIAVKENCSPNKVGYWVDKFGLRVLSKFDKSYQKDVEHGIFNKIDTKEKAYIAGFILGDGAIGDRHDVEVCVAIQDKQILDSISDWFPWEIKLYVDNTLDKKKRRFPRVRMTLKSRGVGRDLVKHFGSRLKLSRRCPRLAKHLEMYLVAGLFDADGCVTWGYRKDRNRLWHKVSFTSPRTILVGVQNILIKYNISTMIRPKGNEAVDIIEFANRQSIENFYGALPTDVMRLKRKVDKYDILMKNIKK